MNDLDLDQDMNFDAMGVEQLTELAAKIKAAEQSAKERSLSEVKELAATLVAKCNALGIKVNSFFREEKVTPRYMNTDNHDETWKGRGPKPKWLKKALKGLSEDEAELKLESYRIQQ